LLLGEGLVALVALVNLVGQPVVDELIGKVHRVKAYGEIVDSGEIPVPATVANKIILHDVYLLFLPEAVNSGPV
jgi:hypothetical protein